MALLWLERLAAHLRVRSYLLRSILTRGVRTFLKESRSKLLSYMTRGRISAQMPWSHQYNRVHWPWHDEALWYLFHVKCCNLFLIIVLHCLRGTPLCTFCSFIFKVPYKMEDESDRVVQWQSSVWPGTLNTSIRNHRGDLNDHDDYDPSGSTPDLWETNVIFKCQATILLLRANIVGNTRSLGDFELAPTDEGDSNKADRLPVKSRACRKGYGGAGALHECGLQ